MLKCTFCTAALVSVVLLLRCLSLLGCSLYPRRSLYKKKKKSPERSHSGICYISTILYLYEYLFLETQAMLPHLYAWEKKSSSGNQNQIWAVMWSNVMSRAGLCARCHEQHLRLPHCCHCLLMTLAVTTVKASGLYCFVFEGFTAFSLTQDASDNDNVWQRACPSWQPR